MTERRRADLLQSARAGCAEALNQLWRDHRRWVAAVLLAHAPAGVDLEDLLQDVAVTVVANLHRLRAAGAFRPWLRAIAINAARTAARRRAVQKRRVGPLPETPDDWPADPARERDRQEAATRERLQRVLTLLAGMHPDYREPMWLRAVEGMSQQQIADALALPVTTIETRLARGRRMLRAAIQAEAEAPCPVATVASAPKTRTWNPPAKNC
jgi:RNA polymerase sigma-70 factor (ECF subfamily)